MLDLSASISTDTYARIGATLDGLADSGGRYGLIVFSDTAYLALPPGTPAAELRAFARRFDVPEQTGGAITVPTNPWTNAFSAGTKISSGLQLALDTIKERRLGRPAVLLVSDLDDDVGDLERLTSTALAFRRLEIPVRHGDPLHRLPLDRRPLGGARARFRAEQRGGPPPAAVPCRPRGCGRARAP